MRIILDNIVFSLQKSGGISVYWYEMISRILNEKKTFFTFIEEESKIRNIFRDKLEIELVHLGTKNNVFINCFSRYIKVNLNVVNTKFIFHSTYYRTLTKKTKNNNNVKEVVTVHDFTYELFSKGVRKWVHAFQKRSAIKAADVIICISENTKKDLLHFYPEFRNKDIRVIYNGVSDDYYILPTEKTVIKIKLFFLFVGSRVSYKNFNFVIQAVAQTKDFVLKIVGSKLSEKEIKLLNFYLGNRWEFLENIDNTKLNILYNEAFALLYPSSYEGFGIPLLESMKAGCPFIAMNSSSIPEIADKAGVLLENLSIDEFNIAIDKIVQNRDCMIELGLQQSKKFSWDKCYEDTLNIYKELSI